LKSQSNSIRIGAPASHGYVVGIFTEATENDAAQMAAPLVGLIEVIPISVEVEGIVLVLERRQVQLMEDSFA
jgi:hypothetical protein